MNLAAAFLYFFNRSILHSCSLALVLITTAILTLISIPASGAEVNVRANQLPISLGPYLDYFEDPDQNLNIQDIINNEQSWQRSSQEIPTMGMSDSAFWFSLVLSGEGLSDLDLLLTVNAPVLDELEFFFIQDNRVISSSRAGDSVPLSEQLYRFRIPAIPFEISLGSASTTVYIRAVSGTGVELPLTLTTFRVFASDQQAIMMFYGAALALFAIGLIICAALYLVAKQQQFAGATLFFASIIPFILTQSGLGRLWFWGENIEINSRLSLIATCGAFASFCIIGRSMNFDSQYRGRVNIVLRFIFYSLIPFSLYFLLIPYEFISAENVQILTLLGLSIVVMVLCIAGITAIQGAKSALYLFLAWNLIIIVFLTFIAYKFAWIERASSISVIEEGLIAMAAVLILMSVAEFIRTKNEELAGAHMATKAKGEFLRHISREFLTPVHLILSNSKRLLAAQSKSPDDPTRQHLSTVINQSSHLHNLINDLLEMAELESDNFEPEFDLLEMSAFLNEIKNLMTPSILEKGLELSTKFATANLLVQTDKSRLQHVLVNLITNAIKYTDKGNILLAYKAIYFQRKLGIEISIEDTGRGMSEEFQQRLFQEFSREEDLDEKDPQGTGLGLVIVKRMIEKLGGEIDFESQKNTGSKFFIRLPLRVHKD